VKRKGDSDLGCTVMLSGLVLCGVLCFISYVNGVTAGRIDIASGRVKATQVVNADGLTEWKFEEAHK